MVKPNLIVFLTDQQRVDTLACYGNSNVHAPNQRIPVEYLDRAVRTARELYTELARLPARVA